MFCWLFVTDLMQQRSVDVLLVVSHRPHATTEMVNLEDSSGLALAIADDDTAESLQNTGGLSPWMAHQAHFHPAALLDEGTRSAWFRVYQLC